MSAHPPSSIERECAERHGPQHACACVEPQPLGWRPRLAQWRREQILRNALNAAGEPGLVLDVACGVGRYWAVMGERSNRMILAADPSPDTLKHARTHQSASLLTRIRTFQSSAFSIGLSANAVDCIVCSTLFQHLTRAEHRMALLQEFQRVSRDTLIVVVELAGRCNWAVGREAQAGPGVGKSQLEGEFKAAGFKILMHQDVLPGIAATRVYVLRKLSQD